MRLLGVFPMFVFKSSESDPNVGARFSWRFRPGDSFASTPLVRSLPLPAFCLSIRMSTESDGLSFSANGFVLISGHRFLPPPPVRASSLLTTTPIWSKGTPPTTFAAAQIAAPKKPPILRQGRSKRTRSPVSRPAEQQKTSRVFFLCRECVSSVPQAKGAVYTDPVPIPNPNQTSPITCFLQHVRRLVRQEGLMSSNWNVCDMLMATSATQLQPVCVRAR